MLSKAEINVLKRRLPRGAAYVIIQRLKHKGKTPSSYRVVSAVLRGDYYNQDILFEAVEYAREVMQTKHQGKKFIKSAIKEIA